MNTKHTAEARRLAEDAAREKNWKRWGPYLSERQWGTVREDYSGDGSAWTHFPHDHARSRAYRWGEDGLLGFTDRQCRLCFALALWNGADAILKERLFGLTGPEGNHGEDVKELYYYRDATPTYSYAQALYRYPQRAFPYEALVRENARRGKAEPEYELADSGVLDGQRYFDVQVEYAKHAPEDVLVRVTVTNRADVAAELHLLPTIWFRNTWSWGRTSEEHGPKPSIRPGVSAAGTPALVCEQAELGSYTLAIGAEPGHGSAELLFTDNETNAERLFRSASAHAFVKDAFHDYVVAGRREAVNPARAGTKAAAHLHLRLAAGEERSLDLRLARSSELPRAPFGRAFDEVLRRRRAEADEFYAERIPAELDAEERRVARAAYAGLLWSKQFYHYVVPHWLEGDPATTTPPEPRKRGRNVDWPHLYNRDLVSMPDKWEYPWYAAWDLAFHMLPFARIDPDFAKGQLELFLREWYMHPNGQIPAYEWALSDVNPPVHAWAAWRVYKKTGRPGARDVAFLKRVFHKLLLNFNWWVNRKDRSGKHIFAGGFLGLDNIGVFDRSAPLPSGGVLDQADGTAWMAFYCGTMLSISIELASHDHAYEDLASKFFEHYVAIVDAMNALGGSGLWDEHDGFYYDQMHIGDRSFPLRLRSLVGVIPLIAVEILEKETIERLPGFRKRLEWFRTNRADLARHIGYVDCVECHDHQLLSIPSRERLERVLAYLLDEREFLSPFGFRSLSRVYEREPYRLELEGREYRVDYAPAEGDSALFGGNSNWRGPVWFPINFLLVEALERYAHFYGDTFEVECPTGSGKRMSLDAVAREIATRLTRLFLPDASGARPCNGGDERYRDDPAWHDLVLFHEYFHAETGRGVGASHQTGWTALVASLLEGVAAGRVREAEPAAEERTPVPTRA